MSKKPNSIALIDMDGVVVIGNSNIAVATELGQRDFALELEEQRKRDEINTAEYNRRISKIYEGLTQEDILSLWDKLPKIGDIEKTNDELKRRYVVPVILTSGLGDFARICTERFGFFHYHGAELVFQDGKSTGERNLCVEPEDKIVYAKELCRTYAVEESALTSVEDSISGLPIFMFLKEVDGKTIAFNDYEGRLSSFSDHSIKSDSLYSIVQFF
ncbi:MAG: hypothetical protein GTN38_01875 [Candidatus Aenigmarchaeota archaeon]|nr:hypothetical protein [Candidatus Aenigmarchaeota archaeon]NIP40305.1 hypothetical protein [Candidatus Aenigmarchaeota archaeon]NIQ17797.1 hypothetical protein [Candidatus Aenigmarchaeota archaeon]NIS73180.1 hypothetical protein [Candidatus Aenigmarchaeota archaeon]